MTVIVAQLGARMHYGVPRVLHAEGQLERLYTDICSAKGWPRFLRFVPSNILPGGLRRLQERMPIGIPAKKIMAFTQFGYEYALKRSQVSSITESIPIHLWASDRFSELIAACGFGAASMVYGFNSASEGMLRLAKASGLIGVLEQTSAPCLSEQRILSEDASAFPGWGECLSSNENIGAFAAREKREWELADRILVASDFVKKEIEAIGGPVDKCCVVPYGVDRDRFSMVRNTYCSVNRNNPLRVLFVGGVRFQKGVHYLLAAMGKLKSVPIQCRIVGGLSVKRQVLDALVPQNVEIVGPVARGAIQREYAWADVFCLPSLCEGSATVIYEALAAGLPVVSTPNSGSIVRDGIEGFIVPIRDSDAIADCLERLSSNRNLLSSMSEAACARSAYGSLDAYAKRLLDALEWE